nr:MAG TPA: hypothetical protein [Caudoviricetes sp.]
MSHFRKEELWILFYCANGDNLIVQILWLLDSYD